MAKLKLGLSDLNAVGVVVKANEVVAKMSGNVNFPAPEPALPVVAAKATALNEAIIAASTRDSTKIVTRNLKRNELKVLLRQLGSYVQDESKGDENKILSSGFEVARRGIPYGILPAPVGLLAKPGIITGTVLLRWKLLPGARAYVIEMNAADPNVEASWAWLGTATQCRYIAEGLTSGQVYWFRVRALGAAGEGGQSDPAHSRAQ